MELMTEPNGRQQLVAADIATGMTAREVADKHGVSQGYVSTACSVCGGPTVKQMRRRRKMARDKAILAEFARGDDVRAIAEAHGLAVQSIRQIAWDNRCCSRHTIWASFTNFRILYALLVSSDGASQDEISKQVGVSRQRVSQIAVMARIVGFVLPQDKENDT